MKVYISKIIGAFATAFVIAFTSFNNVQAQKKMERLMSSTPEERSQFQTQLLKQKLGLSDDQEKQVKAITLKYAQKMEPVLKGDQSKIEKFKVAKAFNKDKEAEYKVLFTTEQFEKYKQAKSELRAAVRAKLKEENKSSQ